MDKKISSRKKCLVCGNYILSKPQNRVTCSKKCSRKYSYLGTRRYKKFLDKQ